MACNKVAFDEFQIKSTEVIHVNITSDSKMCVQMCKNQSTVKSYYYDGEKCKCLSIPYAENEKHVNKLGAPKGCPVTFEQESCVSYHYYLQLKKLPLASSRPFLRFNYKCYVKCSYSTT